MAFDITRPILDSRPFLLASGCCWNVRLASNQSVSADRDYRDGLVQVSHFTQMKSNSEKGLVQSHKADSYGMKPPNSQFIVPISTITFHRFIQKVLIVALYLARF